MNIIARKRAGGVFGHTWRHTQLNQFKITISSPQIQKSATADRKSLISIKGGF